MQFIASTLKKVRRMITIKDILLWLPRRYQLIPQKEEEIGRASMLPEQRPMLDQLQRAALGIEIELEDRDEQDLYLHALNPEHSLLGGPYASVQINQQESADPSIRILTFVGFNKHQKPVEQFCAQETFKQGVKNVQIFWMPLARTDWILIWTIQKNMRAFTLDAVLPSTNTAKPTSTPRPTEMINLVRAHSPTFLARP